MPRKKAVPKPAAGAGKKNRKPSKKRKQPSPNALREAAAKIAKARAAVASADKAVANLVGRTPHRLHIATDATAKDAAAAFRSENEQKAKQGVSAAAAAVRRDMAELGNRVAELQDAASDHAALKSGPHVAVQVRMWTRHTVRETGLHLIDHSHAPVQYLRGGDRGTIYDGAHHAYTCNIDKLSDVVPAPAVRGIQVSSKGKVHVYWTNESIATWPTEEQPKLPSIERDLSLNLGYAPTPDSQLCLVEALRTPTATFVLCMDPNCHGQIR